MQRDRHHRAQVCVGPVRVQHRTLVTTNAEGVQVPGGGGGAPFWDPSWIRSPAAIVCSLSHIPGVQS